MEEPVVPDPTLIITLSQFSDLSLCLGVRVLHCFKDKTKSINHSATQLTRLRFSPQLVQLENIFSAAPPAPPAQALYS